MYIATLAIFQEHGYCSMSQHITCTCSRIPSPPPNLKLTREKKTWQAQKQRITERIGPGAVRFVELRDLSTAVLLFVEACDKLCLRARDLDVPWLFDPRNVQNRKRTTRARLISATSSIVTFARLVYDGCNLPYLCRFTFSGLYYAELWFHHWYFIWQYTRGLLRPLVIGAPRMSKQELTMVDWINCPVPMISTVFAQLLGG